ncbi:ribonuclease HII [Oceanibium sediminis]|uniref:ribonuclease HII n=1 Tax=Oceanibium sediminis TaxID=2026339 RepID=UPI000DD39E7A|nr:ribonuclease HII [Oceanibium sediminis]
MQGPNISYETEYPEQPVCGVDEVGRGPWAGPVVAAAVILDPARIPEGLRDSKKLSAKRREALTEQLRAVAQVGIGIAEVAEIDSLNILKATMLAMCRAIGALPVAPGFALVDGNRLPPDLPCPGLALVKGDDRSASIAAASIVAKTTRDAMMVALAQQFPGYGWETNAGYGVKTHAEALKTLGVTPHHRRSFKPIHNILCQEH